MKESLQGRDRRERPADVEVPEGAVRIIESHHAPNFEMAMGSWPFRKMAWVVMGRGRLQTPHRTLAIQRDDFLFLSANWRHRFLDDEREPLTLVVLCVSEAFFSASPERDRLDPWAESSKGQVVIGAPMCARSGFHRTRLQSVYRGALRESGTRQEGWDAALGVAATTLLVYGNRDYLRPRAGHAENSRQTVEGSLDYLLAHLQEPLQIEEVARLCQLSPRRYTQLFKEITGQTFNRFLRSKRIDFACQRLNETGHILYACHESGFNDPAYFYRVFKQEKGLTPGQYLQAAQRRRPSEIVASHPSPSPSTRR